MRGWAVVLLGPLGVGREREVVGQVRNRLEGLVEVNAVLGNQLGQVARVHAAG